MRILLPVKIVPKFVGRVSSWVSWVQCHRAIVPSWVFREPKISARGYFVGPKFLLVGISWAQKTFSWVFRGSQYFFVGPRFFLVGISWVLNFLSWVTSLFSVADRMRESGIEIYLKLRNLLQIDFDNCEFCLYQKGTSSNKLLSFTINYAALVCTSCIFGHLFLGNRISSLVIEIHSYC